MKLDCTFQGQVSINLVDDVKPMIVGFETSLSTGSRASKKHLEWKLIQGVEAIMVDVDVDVDVDVATTFNQLLSKVIYFEWVQHESQ